MSNNQYYERIMAKNSTFNHITHYANLMVNESKPNLIQIIAQMESGNYPPFYMEKYMEPIKQILISLSVDEFNKIHELMAKKTTELCIATCINLNSYRIKLARLELRIWIGIERIANQVRKEVLQKQVVYSDTFFNKYIMILLCILFVIFAIIHI